MIKPIIRLAVDSEAPAIEALLKEAGLIPAGLDWSRIYPFWMVAEMHGEIVGCIQVLVGMPIGHVNFLAVRRDKQNLGLGVFLIHAAEQALAQSGCDGFQTTTDHQQIMAKSAKLNLTIFGPSVNWVFKRIAQVGKHENIQAHCS